MPDPHYFHPHWIKPTDETLTADLCIYGGNAAGIIAAVTAARRGRSVVLLQPGRHLGGMTSGGLGWTDFGRQYCIGGAARQFYRALGRHYGKQEEWRFEPHVAEQTLNAMIAATGAIVRFDQFLDQVRMIGKRLAAVRMLGGLAVKADQFLDTTYEGDLLAKAGVTYALGRESNQHYDETLNGVQVHRGHQFYSPVDPYVVPNDPASGLLPYVIDEDLSPMSGRGDKRLQAYCFRLCLTDDPQLRIAWEKPAGFDPRLYELATRWYNSDKDPYNEVLPEPGSTVPRKFDLLPNPTAAGFHKTDTNNHGSVSSDFIGANYAWPEADYPTREKIFQNHVTYQKGLYWHLANDPAIPRHYRDAYQRWGLARDEFVDTGHWPHQLYVREARRMVGDYVITEHDCTGAVHAQDSIGLGSYTMDSHNCTRFIKIENGQARVLNEGNVQTPLTEPYPISYRAIVPRRGECENLIVPVCFSASHIAYGSARMEPVFMVLGESAAIAADLALDAGAAVQDLPYHTLRPELQKAGQVLELNADKHQA